MRFKGKVFEMLFNSKDTGGKIVSELSSIHQQTGVKADGAMPGHFGHLMDNEMSVYRQPYTPPPAPIMAESHDTSVTRYGNTSGNSAYQNS